MNMEKLHSTSRPAALVALVIIEAIMTVLGLGSAFGLLLSPSGAGFGLSLDLLENTPVGDFTLVGLFFLVFYGALPGLATYGLVTKRRWLWTDPINKWTGQYWGWTASAAVGVILLVWIAVELVLLGFLSGIGGVLQIVMALMGVLMLVLAMLPSVRSFMKLAD